jgi:aerobic C4-dicarboxylate transport protein
VPTGYSFSLDGTAIYLAMATLFIAAAQDARWHSANLTFMIIASKGAAGVSGVGIATLASGLQSHRPGLVNGVGFILGIDRFMSEARALTNFAGNAVVIGSWMKEFDRDRSQEVFAGNAPFNEATVLDDNATPTASDN